MTELDEHLEIDVQKIKDSIRLQVPIEVTSYTLPRNMDLYMHKVLECFLEECRQEHLKEYLNFCLGEILTNGKKANTKRIYFKDKGLDINDPKDYEEGMKTCKDDTMNNLDYYLELQRKAGLYVKLSLKLDIDNIVVEIKNNSVLTVNEEQRIKNKLDSVQQYHTMEEVLAKVLDTTEGAGLGIIIMILMLQKVGLSKDNFKIFSTDKETITRIVLPCNNNVYQELYDVSERFTVLEKQFPIFENVLNEIDGIVNSPKIDRNKVLNCVRRNISLAMAVLKKAAEKNIFELNLYSVIVSLTDSDLKEIFSKTNSFFRIVPESDDLKYLFEHARKVSVLCYNLAKNAEKLQLDFFAEAEHMFAVGLLSSAGMLMIKSKTPEQAEIVNAMQNNDARYIFETGITSGFINLQYAKSIGFPDSAAYQMAGWNCLRLCPPQVASFMRILYLAEIIQYYSEGFVEFYQINKDVLSSFKINDETQLHFVLEQIKTVL